MSVGSATKHLFKNLTPCMCALIAHHIISNDSRKIPTNEICNIVVECSEEKNNIGKIQVYRAYEETFALFNI